MFSKNKKQYVNILKQNKQLKLDYTILQDTKIVKHEQSSFLITDENIPKDALYKLDTLQKNIPHTYLVSLIEGGKQKIIPTSDVDVIGYNSVKIDHNLSIVIPKNEIISTSRYFTDCGIDYIISPLSILNEYIKSFGVKNSLNVFIYNNVIYTIILDHLKQITYSEIKELTPFDDVQDDSFASDDIVGQKLYDEVHFLEIQQFLSEVTQNYYSRSGDIEFLEKVDILYDSKSLDDEQLNSLYETMMVKIDYKPINLEEYINNITYKIDANSYNFTEVRAKKESGNIFIWIVIALISLSIVTAVVYYKIGSKKTIKQQPKVEKKPIQKTKVIKKVQPKPIKLPNHIVLNNSISQDIYMLFDVVPYDAILKDLEITKENATYVVNFTVVEPSLDDMHSKLLNIFKESNILLKNKNKAILNTIIENNKMISTRDTIDLQPYKRYDFLSTSKATQYIKKMLPQNSTIKYLSKDLKKYLQYTFSIKSVITTPKEFFDFIEQLNKQNLSIVLEYPIRFSKLNNSLEVKYHLHLYQQNKKLIKLKQ